MNTNTNKTAAEQALLWDLVVDGSADRAKLLSLFSELATPATDGTPDLPEDLSRRQEEKFGTAQARPARTQTRPGVFAHAP